jgi:hypothetical protein
MNFITDWYLKQYLDVKLAKVSPIAHWLNYGRKEGRYIIPPIWYLKKISELRKKDFDLLRNKSEKTKMKKSEMFGKIRIARTNYYQYDKQLRKYLKFVEKNDTVFIRKDRVLKLERKAKKITIGFPSKSVATEIEKEILSQLFNINKKLNLYFTNEKIYIELISIVNVESLRNHSISTGERKFELND